MTSWVDSWWPFSVALAKAMDCALNHAAREDCNLRSARGLVSGRSSDAAT